MFLALLLSGFFLRPRWWIRALLAVYILPWVIAAAQACVSFHWMLQEQGLVDGALAALFGIEGPIWFNDRWLGLGWNCPSPAARDASRSAQPPLPPLRVSGPQLRQCRCRHRSPRRFYSARAAPTHSPGNRSTILVDDLFAGCGAGALEEGPTSFFTLSKRKGLGRSDLFARRGQPSDAPLFL